MIVSLQPTAATQALTAPLVVVIPIFNEADNIQTVVDQWGKTLVGIAHQFLLINDGSKDNTLEILTQMERHSPTTIVVIDKPNSGHGRTCRLGYDAATISPTVEWILQIDSDGQCDPSYFPQFWEKRTEADCIFGRRVKRDDGLPRAITSKLCKFGTTLLGGRDMVDPNVPYRLISKEILAKALPQIPASFNIHNVALTYILKKTPGVRFEHIPIHFPNRQGGNNSINLLNVIQWGVDMLLELRKLKTA